MAARDTSNSTVSLGGTTLPAASQWERAAMPAAASPKSVLLATGSDGRRSSLRDALERAGFAVAEALTGEAAIWSVCREHPAALVMDCTLPGVPGLRAAEVLKEEPALRGIPILLLGSGGAPEERERALDAGCDHFLAEAEDPGEVLEAVRRLTEPAGAWVDRTGASR
jgi:CheY-like chemotaxis protein